MRGSEAGVQQVVVPEGAQGHVLGSVGLERHPPGLLAVSQAQGVLLRRDFADAGLGVVGGDLAPHHPVVLAAGQQGHAVHVPGDLQGEGFGDGDGLEQVLHAQERALPGPGRRHRQQDGRAPVASIAEQSFLDVEIHKGCLSIGSN